MPVTLLRDLPDAQVLVQEVLRQCGASVSSVAPADLATKLPWLTAYRFAGAAPHPQFLDAASIQVSAWASTEADAADLAETARVLLFQAWRRQWTTVNGTIHRVSEIVGPFPVRTDGQPDGVYRCDGSYRVWTRPAT